MKKVIYNGVEMPVGQAAIKSKIYRSVIYNRMNKGLTQETGLFHTGNFPIPYNTCVLNGKEIELAEAAEIVGMTVRTLRGRLKEGLTQETGLFIRHRAQRQYTSITKKQTIQQEKIRQEKQKIEKVRIEKMNQDQAKKDYEKTGQSVDKIEQIREKRRQRQYKINDW